MGEEERDKEGKGEWFGGFDRGFIYLSFGLICFGPRSWTGFGFLDLRDYGLWVISKTWIRLSFLVQYSQGLKL